MNNEAINANDEQFEQLVVFRLADEYYGVDIAAVNTIIRMQGITEVPRTPDFVEGVINLRGSIIPVIDLRTRFSLPCGELVKTSRIVVVEASGQMIGMIVDAVAETLHLPKSSIEPPSPVISCIDTEYLRGVGKQDDRLVILLDMDKVLSASEASKLSKLENSSSQEGLVSAKAA